MTSFWSWQLIVAMGLNGVVQAISVASDAARVAGARSGRVGTAMSLYNLFVTASRFASMLYSPMLGVLSDRAGQAGDMGGFLWQLRAIVIAGTVGIVVGAIAIPVFVRIYMRGIRAFERAGNVVKAFLRALRPRTIYSVVREILAGGHDGVFRLTLRNVPKDAIVLNALVSSVFAIGIVAAAYASVLDPVAARTALLSSGLINGLAVIAYNIVVDPAAAFMTDQVARGERTVDDVKALVTGLSLSAVSGFALSQFLLVPAAYVIVHAAVLFAVR